MADARINVEIGYSIDKKSYDQLMNSLETIQTTANAQDKSKGIDVQLQAAGKAAKELQSIMMKSWDTKLNQVNLTTLNNEFKKAGQTASNFYTTLSKGHTIGIEGANQFARLILNTNTQLKQSNQLLDKMAVTFKNTIRYGISSSIFNTFTNSVQKAYTYTKNLDTSLNDIRIVSGKSAEQMAQLAVSANKAAQALGKTTLDYTKAATIYYQQGLSSDEVEKRTEATLKAANVTGQNAQEVSEQLTAVWNGYRVTGEELELYVDKLAAVAAHSASNLEELSTGMSKVASAAKEMGVDIDQLNAQMSTIISVTRQAPESVGTALRTIYARIADINAGLDEETSLGNYSGKMAQLGINVLKADGSLRAMGEVIEEVGTKWQDLDSAQRIALARTMAGTRQYNNLLTLFNNWDKYQKALEIAQDAAGTLNKQQEIYMQSTEAHLKQMTAEAEELYSALFNQEAARSFIDLMKEGLDVLGNYVKSLGGGMGTLVGLGSQLANIFSNQIAGTIGRGLTNLETRMQQQDAVAVKQNLIQNIKDTHNLEGQNIEDAGLEKELAYAERILKVKNSLSDTQAKELTDHQKMIGLLEDELQEQNKILAAKQNSANKLKADIKGLDVKQDSAAIQGLIDKHQEVIADMSKAKDAGNLSLEEEKALEFLQERLKALEAYKQKVIEIEGVEEQRNQKQQEQAARESIAQQELAQLERQQQIQNVIRVTTGLLSTMTTIQSISNIITDKDLSNWDKFKSIVSVVAMQIPILLNTYSALAPALSKVATAMGLKAAATAADAAATAADSKENAENAVKTGANTVSQLANTLSRKANAAGTGAQVASSVTHTAALGAEKIATDGLSVSTAILKAILGDVSGLTMLAVAGIAAATLAIGAWAVSTLEAADAENKLQKELNSAQENLQNVKEKYEEIKTTFSNYSTALDGIDNLTEGTLEFYDAILKANAEAEKLISQFGLIAGQDYTFDKNGLIKISQNTQDKIMFNEQQKVYRGQINVSDAKKRQADNDLEKLYAEFNEKLSQKEQVSYRLLNDKQTKDLLEGKGFGEVSGKSWDGYSYLGNYKNAGGDLNDIMAEYSAKYKALKLEQENYFNASQANRVRGYGSKKDVETYNSMNETGQKIFNKALQLEDNRNRLIGKQYANGTDDYENMGFAENPFGLKKILTGIGSGIKYMFSGQTKKDLEQNAIESQGMQYFRENYAKNNGYKQKNGKWYKNGEEVDLKDEFSNETAVEYYNNTKAVNTEENVKNLTEKYNKAFKAAQDNGFGEVSSKNIAANALAVQSGNMGGFDASMLDTKDRDELIRYLKEDIQASNDTLNAVQVTMDATVYNPTKKAVEELQVYNQILADQAEQIGTTQSALEAYADAMRNAGVISEDLNEENADIIANAFKFNKVYNESVKVYKDSKDALNSYVKALKATAVPSTEAAEAAGDVRDQLKQMGLNIKSIDLKDDNTFKNVKKLFEGTEQEAEKAYKELEKLSLENSIAQPLETALANATDPAALASLSLFKTQISDFVNDISNLKPGDTIDGQWSEALINMVNNAHMTQEEVESLFKGMNLTIPTPVVPETDTSNVKTPEVETTTVPGNATRHHAKGWYPDPTNPKEKIEIDYYWDEWTDDSNVSFVKYDPKQKIKYTGGGKGSGAFARNPSNTDTKKSGSSKPTKKDLNKDELDRYQLVNVQLKEISKQLSALEKQKKKLLGGNLVKNLNKQISLLDKQIDTTEKKLKIAEQEQAEVAQKLAKVGVKFDNEGNISNYAAVFKQEQAKLNNYITYYNKLSKTQQEAKADELKQYEENWKKFKENITKYDNLIGETIPQLQQDIQDAFDKQTEMLIEKFNMEIDLRLDINTLTRDWNEFRRKVIDDIKDDDILGTAKAKLKDFYSYFNDTNTGDVQVLTSQLQKQLEEVKKQMAGKSADWYRDNDVEGLDKLKERYEQIKESLLAIVELEEEMHQKVLEMLDETQEKFDEQLGIYENIGKQLEHNVDLINLLSDGDDYENLSRQYALQTQNRKEQLDFYTKQKEYWSNYMRTLQEGSEEWENAKEKYNAAADAWASALKNTIETARTEFENNIKLIFKTINNQLTNGKGLDYLDKEWQLINENSELALDNINRLQGIQNISKKYTDAINGTSNITAQKKLAELRDKELEQLKTAGSLSEKDLERAEKKLDIAKAQIALEDAQRNKTTMRLRRDSQGNYRYQFVADEDEINKAQEQLSNAYNELYNFDKERFNSTSAEIYEAYKAYQEELANIALINDPVEKQKQEELVTTQWHEKKIALEEQLARIQTDLTESTFANLNSIYAKDAKMYELFTTEQQAALNGFEQANQTAFDLIFGLQTQNTDNFRAMTKEYKDTILGGLIPQTKAGIGELLEQIKGEEGFQKACTDLWQSLEEEAAKYQAQLESIKNTGSGSFGSIEQAQQEVIRVNSELLDSNDALIDKYARMTAAVQGEYEQLKLLMNQYKEAADQAKQAAEDAYETIKKYEQKQADDVKEDVDKGSNGGQEPGNNNNNNNNNNPGQNPLPASNNFKGITGISSHSQLVDVVYGIWQGCYGTGKTRYAKIEAAFPGQYSTIQGLVSKTEAYKNNKSGMSQYLSNIGYDTGGYTGEWGNNGRLAFLHQKELVLNKQDTTNMLNAVEIMRGITENIGADLLGRMAGITAGGFNSSLGNGAIDQNVHIEATFPGVKNAVEIETALNNLVNMASQRALQK